MRIDWFDKLRNLLQVLAFALTVASLQFFVQPEKPYVLPLVYSLCISLCTWALIDFGRHVFPSARRAQSAKERAWPSGWGAVLLPALGIVGGYVAGTLLADAWFGWSSWSANPDARAQLPFSIVITAVAGVVASYYFYSQYQAAALREQVEEVSRQSSEAKLKLLEAQLEPHMLFNTLANLRALIGSDPQRAITMLDQLISFLRATLQASRSGSHTLQDEFARLNDYLQLMQVRMGPRLRYTLTLPLELARHPLPPLLLQPLVENAIAHGLEPQVAGGEVLVSAERCAQGLRLVVQDSGVGLGSSKSDSSSGFGLRQVRERLATAYGNRAAIELIAGNAGGVSVSITLPFTATV